MQAIQPDLENLEDNKHSKRTVKDKDYEMFHVARRDMKIRPSAS